MEENEVKGELVSILQLLTVQEGMPEAVVVFGDHKLLIEFFCQHPDLAEYIFIWVTDSEQLSLSSTLEERLHSIIVSKEMNITEIESGLEHLHFDLSQILYISLYLAPQDTLNLAKGLQTDYGFIALEIHSIDTEIDSSDKGALICAQEWLIKAATFQLFPKKGFSVHYPHNKAYTRVSLNYFEKRLYKIRHPDPEDIESLHQLEKKCWPKALQISKQGLLKRIKRFSQGIYVIERDASILGAGYSQRILDEKVLLTTNFHQVESFSHSEGPIIQLLAINVPSAREQVGLGDELLEFMLQVAAVTKGIEGVVGVTRTKDYIKHQHMLMADYIQLKDSAGAPVDSVLRLHHQHGGQIVTEILGYRPEDEDNKTYGVLIHYDVLKLQFKRPEIRPDKQYEMITQERIKSIIDSSIKKIMGEGKEKNYSSKIPLMNLGLESLDLLDLRIQLQSALQTEIHPTFFFQHGTGDAIQEYFVTSFLDKYKDWLYGVEWAELSIPIQEHKRFDEAGLILIFLDESLWGKELITKLISYGYSVIRVKIGTCFTRLSPTEFLIRPQEISDYEALFQDNSLSKGIHEIIYLWGLFNPIADLPSLATLSSLHATSCSGLLNIVKSTLLLKNNRIPKLYVVSWSLQEEGDSMALAQGPMIGLCKAIGAEHPDFELKRVFLDRGESRLITIDNFFLELFAKDKEDQITWREGKRLAPRLIRVELPEMSTTQFQEHATYILTGGLGDLGLQFVRWYVERGAKYLVIFDQEAMIPEVKVIIDDFKSQGIHFCIYEHCEFTNFEQMKGHFSEIETHFPPIKGVMHTAGFIDDDLLINMDWSRFSSIFDLKVGGAWILHQLTLNYPLDHFILFSTVGSTMGPLWRANRASASAFLDALAFYRHSRQLPVLTINWTPWDHEGITRVRGFEKQLPSGMGMLKVKEGMQVLDRILGLHIPEVIVATINWRKYLLSQPVDRPLFAYMASECGLKKSEIIRRFHHARKEEKQDVLKRYLRTLLRRILLLSPTTKLNDEQAFSELGLDDRAFIELRNLLQFDMEAAITVPFEIVSANSSIELLSKALYPMLMNFKHLKQSGHEDNEQIKKLQEPIAIIGIGCRFPGGVNNLEQFWNLLDDGIDAITEVPANRWDIDAYYDSDKEVPGKMYTRYGGFIEQVDLFDPQFFGISPREAEDMDPQQRVSLEVTWEALEHAGIPASSLKGSNTGVFIGICFNDYGQLIRQSGDVSAVDNYYSTGNHYSVTAGRISYILGLEGPAMAIDTACSSSLVSIDNAVKHLRLGQCNLAIAGGVNLILAPESSINFCKSGMLAEDGRCKTFDAKADGYVRSEGCGILILKRLSDALEDKDKILAVICATAVNQDGASTGLTVPNEKAQENLIKEALKSANLRGKDIHYLEAHGTGTSLGDPIEVRAISATYGEDRSLDNPLYIGSVKTNIGHTEAAAGVAGLIKCVLALQQEQIPQHLHFQELNPYITISPDSIKIAAKPQEWISQGHARYAAVSSFGFSGTNSHAILSDLPKSFESDTEKPPFIFPISAKTEQALTAQQQGLKAFLETHPQVNLSDVAFTLQFGREHFEHRKVIIGKTREDMLDMSDESPHLNLLSSTEQKAILKWLAGDSILWEPFHASQVRKKIHLPTYPFERARYWAKTAIKAQERSMHAAAATHPLLIEHDYLPNGFIKLKGSVDLSTQPTFCEHQVYDHIIFPGVGFIELLAAAVQVIHEPPINSFVLEQVSIEKPLLLNQKKPSIVSVLMTPDVNERDVYFLSVDSERLEKMHKAPSWIHHLTARFELSSQLPEPVDVAKWRQCCPKSLDPSVIYAGMQESGFYYGPAFQALKTIDVGENEALGKLSSGISSELDYVLDPTVMDAALQLLMVLLQAKENKLAASGVFLPIAFEAIKVHQYGFKEAIAYLKLREIASNQIVTADITLCDEQGILLVELLGYQAKYVEGQTFKQLLDSTYSREDLFYELHWEDDAPASHHSELNQRHFLLCGADNLLHQHSMNLMLSQSIKTKSATKSIDMSEHNEITDIVFFCHDDDSRTESTRELLLLIQALSRMNTQKPPQLWVITEDAQNIDNDVNPYVSPAIGFIRTAMNEYPELRCCLIDIDSHEQQGEDDVLHALLHVSNEQQIAYRNHRRMVVRIRPKVLGEHILPKHYHVTIPQKGLLNHLKIESKSINPPTQNEVQIKVHATGLNFRDVLNAMDLYPGNPGPLGLECSGVVSAVGEGVHQFVVGDEVMALAWDSFSDLIHVNAALVTKKPKHLSFSEAATIPLVYQTVYYSLMTLGKLKKGEKILIHAAAGGIGTAAIQLAQWVGAEIYATAHPDKWEFLKEKGVHHLYNSRTLDFSRSVLDDTGGAGVDIVINSLTGEFIESTVNCIKKQGRFIEISKRNIWTDEVMKALRPDIEYYIVAMDQLMNEAPEQIHELWEKLTPLFQEQQFQALPITQFAITEVIPAFRYMQAGKHVGKVVLVHPTKEMQSFLFKVQASYLVTAGLGGLGFELVKWLSSQGVKHLVLTVRRDPSTEQQLILDEIQRQGTSIYLHKTDVNDRDAIQALMQFIKQNCPPLKGIFHTAGIIDDGIIQQQTWSRFESVFAPKVKGSWYLHEATKNLSLDCFVLFSSIVSVLGLAGQSNYAAANAFMDGLCAHRRFIGLPATAINWGPWGEVGMAVRQHMDIPGINALTLKQGFKAMFKVLQSNSSQLIVASFDWELYLKSQVHSASLFSELDKQTLVKTKKEKAILLSAKLSALPEEGREKALQAYLSEQVRAVLNLKENHLLDLNRGFFNIGMDSLRAVELKNKLQQDLGHGTLLMPTLIFNYPSINELMSYYMSIIYPDLFVSKEKEQVSDEVSQNKDNAQQDISIMSEEEIEAMFDEEIGKDSKRRT